MINSKKVVTFIFHSLLSQILIIRDLFLPDDVLEVRVMCDWEWDNMAMVGFSDEMMTDEELERILSDRENEPMT